MSAPQALNPGAPPLAPPSSADNLAGIGLTLLAVFLFAGCNALAKWLIGTYPVGETLFVRAVTALLLVAPFITRADIAVLRAGGRFWLHMLRIVTSGTEVGCFYWAVAELPLADATTIYLAGPIYVTALSALFLGEQVGWRRWTAVFLGFIGVVVALRPTTASLTPHAMVAVLGSVLNAISLVATRGLRGTPTTLLVASQMAALLVLSAGSANFGWAMPPAGDAVLMAMVGVLAMVAYLCLNRGLQLAPASVVAPFNYASIIGAVVLGVVVFGDVPGAAVLAGAAIIIGAGLFILFRERTVGISKR